MNSAFRYLCSARQKALEMALKCSIGYGDILMFHQVSNNAAPKARDSMCISFASFKELISRLLELETAFPPLDTANIRTTQLGESVYITFDDAFSDVYIKAAPYLASKKIPFAVFIAADFIGMKEYVDETMIHDMLRIPNCFIGSHTLSHPVLRQLNQIDAEKEIVESKRYLEELTARSIDMFAYPYGSLFACSNRNINQVAAAGYSLGFSTIRARLSKTTIANKYFLPRIGINEGNYLSYIRAYEVRKEHAQQRKDIVKIGLFKEQEHDE